MKSFDVIVIGAGHNGMTAAAVLAKSGRQVLVVEAADTVGGMARTTELAPGFRVSPVAHILNKLDKRVIRALDLRKHGFDHRQSAAQTVCLSSDGDHLTLTGAFGENVDGLPEAEKSAWADLRKRLLFQAALLARFDAETPMQPHDAGKLQKLQLMKAAARLKFAGNTELRQFLRMALMCVADVVDESLKDDRLKGLLSFDATLGIRLGPRSPTSLLGLYHKLASGAAGSQIIPKGGMGAVMQTFHSAAKAAGVTFVMSTKVTEILLEAGVAKGVTTSTGETFHAPCVISALSPVTTFLDLVGAPNLDTGFVRDIRTIRWQGNVSRLNLALDRPPEFTGLAAKHLSARLVWAPLVDHVEKNFNPSKYGEMPDAPAFELVVPSATDATMAPDGAATMSIAIQNTPYDLNEGWEAGKKQLEKTVMAQLEKLAPGIGKSVLASELLSPVDIESRFHALGGHWHHGELQVDRLYALRPVFGAAHYRAPISGLYICGAGTHPGGGISGASGLNAAREVMADRAGAGA
jgi:phytoene dehydrogenase-like protein